MERIDSFFRGKDLGLVSINKLEQLRKYIANQYRNRKDLIRTKVSNPKGNPFRIELVNYFNQKWIIRESIVRIILS